MELWSLWALFSIPHSGIPAPGIAYDWTENVRLAVLKKIGDSQFGFISKSSTTLALLSTMDLTPYQTGATVSRVICSTTGRPST